MFVLTAPRHREVGVITLYLDPESKKKLSVTDGWEALVESDVVLTNSMRPGFCKRVNIVLGTKIKTSVRTKQTTWD